MAFKSRRFQPHFDNQQYGQVDEPGDAGQFGGGSGNYQPLEKEINQADKEFAKQDKAEQAKQP